MRIGPLEFPAGAALAPMAGVTDLAMRTLCARYGALFTVSEMVSAKALTMNDRKSLRLLRGGGGGARYGVQLFGHEPDVLAEAVRRIEGEAFDFLDLNLGCPAPKIVGHGAGSGMLKDPARAGEFVRAAVEASSRPVTVKLRIGWDERALTGAEVAKRAEDAGAAMLVVHGRTRSQMYTPGVDYEVAAAIKQNAAIPVLFNGDIDSAGAALHAVRETGCDGVMIGRGAQGAPWLFAEVNAALRGGEIPQPPSLPARLALLEEQVRAMCEEKGEDIAMRQARGVAAAYMRGLRGAATLRRTAHGLTWFSDLADLTAQVYELQKAPEEDPQS